MSFDIKFTGQYFENACGIVGLAERTTCLLEAEPGKLDIKKRKPGILFISLTIGSDYDVVIDFCVDSA